MKTVLRRITALWLVRPLRYLRNVRSVCFGLAGLALFTVLPAFSATTWVVTSTGDDPGDVTTLRGAIAAAANGDTIDLTALTGTITLTYGAFPVVHELFLGASLNIKGPGASNLTISANKFSRVFDIGADAVVSISGLTIMDGVALDGSDDSGGGIRNTGTLTITDCVVSGNSAAFGGGIYNFPGKTLTVVRSEFSNNSTPHTTDYLGFTSAGGAIDADSGGTVNISDASFSDNFGGLGGAIASSASLIVTNSTFTNNSADETGAIFNGGQATISNTIVKNTSANTTQSPFVGSPAAIRNDLDLTVIGSTFSENATIALTHTPFSGQGSLIVTNSTFYHNLYGAILNGAVSGSPAITSSTIVGNGGFGLENYYGGPWTLKNTILANNFRNCGLVFGITSQDHNLSDDTTCAAYLIQPHDFAPHTFAGLDPDGSKDNGGPTPTIALLPTSPAVDAINPSSDCSVTTDQRGVTRPQGAFCDIGAFELTPDFYLSAIADITASVGASGSAGVQVNSAVEFNSPVTLSTSGGPSGLMRSFAPNPVTPPSGGSDPSTLTLKVGPSVPPGSYSLNVTGNSGSLTHSVPVNVNVVATPDGVTGVVGTDQALGCIDNSGISNALTNKLSTAQAYINAGDIQDAINTLTALLNQLKAQAGKHISTVCTDPNTNTQFNPVQVLIADVEALLAGLKTTGVSDPILGYVVNPANVGVSGAIVTIFDASTAIVASMTTDATGFYFFAQANTLVLGATYKVSVTAIPAPYNISTPNSQTFTWSASQVNLSNFGLN
jgi:hypothetical protein